MARTAVLWLWHDDELQLIWSDTMTVSTFIICIAGLAISVGILGATRMAMLSFLRDQSRETS